MSPARHWASASATRGLAGWNRWRISAAVKGGDLRMGVKTGRSDMMGNFAGLSYCYNSIACGTLGGMGKHR